MSIALETSTDLTVKQCGSCGVVFAMPRTLDEECKKTKQTWYCPNGHPRVYRESRAEELERELARERQRRDQAEASARDERERRCATERRLSAAHGQITKTKKRVGNGVCPCCNRTFENLSRHMHTKHPGYAKEEAEAVV